MLNDYEDRKIRGLLYSPALDLLLSWGRTHLMTPEDETTSDKIKVEWDSLIKEPDIATSLNKGLSLLVDDVEDALRYLHSPATLNLFSNGDLETQTALKILDHVAMVSEAVEYLLDHDNLPNGFQEKVDSLLNRVTIDCPPSCIRLIPLNNWRREVRKHISEDKMYFFPWYEYWIELPPDTIDILIEHWVDVSHGKFENLEIDAQTIVSLIAELNTDQKLLQFISKENQQGLLLFKALEKSLSLSLFAIGDNEAGNYSISNKVKAKGLDQTASAIIHASLNPLSDEIDKIERQFLAAFCGPYLDDKERIDLLSKVEEKLISLDASELRSGRPLENLYKWSQDKITSREMSRNVFQYWMKALNNAADTLKETVPSFRHAVENLQYAEIEPKKTILDKLLELVPVMPCYLTEPVEVIKPLSADDITTSDTDKLELKKNTFNLPIKFHEKFNELVIPGEYPNDDLMKLRKFLTDIKYYWIGWYKICEEKEEIINEQPKEIIQRSVVHSLEYNKYEYVVIIISPKKALLEKIISEKKLSDDEAKNVVRIIYEPIKD